MSGLPRIEAKGSRMNDCWGSNGSDACEHSDEPVGVRTVRDNSMQ